MSPDSVVVTGANRGIGLGLVQQLIKDKSIRLIIATARDVEKATELKGIEDPRLHVLQLETTSDSSIDNFVQEVDELVGPQGLSLLINNAGVLIPYTSISRDIITEQLSVNTTSTVILTQKLLPLLKRASGNAQSSTWIINISSFLGSISHNDFRTANQPVLAYRMSKAALNQFTKTLSIDLKSDNISVVSFCPGWVKTDLGGKGAMFTVEQSTKDLVESFGKLNDSHNGGFFSKTLEKYEW